jgi:hypothetical protein
MKDLYKRLGVPIDASADEIRHAAAAIEEPQRGEAEFILLAPRRRAVYDRNHRVLSTIADLRGRLGLALRPFWSHGDHRDFMRSPAAGTARNSDEDRPTFAAPRTIPWGVLWIAACAIATVGTAVWLLLRHRG